MRVLSLLLCTIMFKCSIAQWSGSGDIYYNSGNVGIGTSSPLQKLHVAGGAIQSADGTFSNINARLNGASIPWLRFTRWTGSGSNQQNAFVGQFYNSGEYSFGIGTGSSSSGDQDATTIGMTMTLAGNVGIGTTSPSTLLHVKSASNNDVEIRVDVASGSNKSILGLANAGTVYGKLYFDNSNNNLILSQVYSSGYLGFGTNSRTNDMIVSNSGSVGIGTTSPNKKLEISTPNNVADGIRIGYGGVTTEGLDLLYLNSGASGVYIDSRYNSDAAAMYFRMKTASTPVTAMTILGNGNVAIGTTNPQGYKLAVNGDAIFTKVKVKTYASWPDYVFHHTYKLRALKDLEAYIKANNHLPDVPSAAEVEKSGLDLGDNQASLLKKIEELTLYIIQQDKQIQNLKSQNKDLSEIKKDLEIIKAKLKS